MRSLRKVGKYTHQRSLISGREVTQNYVPSIANAVSNFTLVLALDVSLWEIILDTVVDTRDDILFSTQLVIPTYQRTQF